jgi:quinol monooxygenase YgiN
MWAQLIKMRLRDDGDHDVADVMAKVQAAEQADSGLLRTITMRDQADPNAVYTLVVFENEEKARLREQDPRRAEALAAVQAAMADMFDGAPEFTNLDVVWES